MSIGDERAQHTTQDWDEQERIGISLGHIPWRVTKHRCPKVSAARGLVFEQAQVMVLMP